jgi:ubiquinone/menaquinone biosynthesis C-methylase UbiE
MIENDEVAAEVDAALREAYRVLDNSAALVRQRCTEAETNNYLQQVGNVLYELIFRMMEPLYKAHPELKPNGWTDSPEFEQ